MIKQVVHPPIEDIFHGEKIYRIPKYQREYTWGISEWGALFNDVIANENGYFLGSYICVNNGSLDGTVLEVIDGQQRFTSLMLLFTALYEKLNNLREEMDDEEKADLTNLRGQIAIKRNLHNGLVKNEYQQRLFLQNQNMNDDDFAYILSEKGITTAKKPYPLYFGNRRISKAYKRFGKLVDDIVNDLKSHNPNTSDTSALFYIVRKFQSAIMVGIEVDTNNDAYMLFESLNHRGIPLSALDLIKNTLISQAEKKSDADNSFDDWKQILTNVGQDDYSVQERFFRQYYNAFREELNKPYETPEKKYYFGYLATRTTLLDIYEKMINQDYRRLLDDLLEKSKIYAVITNNSEESYSYSSGLQDLARISGAPSYILLLYIISNQMRMGLSDEHLNAIIRMLITFFVRRNITDIPNTRKLTQLFIDIISDSNDLKGNAVVLSVKKHLIQVSAPDELFENKLRGPIYDENPDATRFLLCSIEAQHQTKEIYSDLWARDNSNKYIWTIEHIFPEGRNIPELWVNMIANGDRKLADQYLADYVHTLGNLTITGYNQNLSNMSFEQKKDRKSKDKTKDIGYRNGLFLNQSVVNEDSWTVEKIKNRTNNLVRILLEMYHW